MNKTELATVEEALHELQQGRMIILVDDESRENEGDLIYPAEIITPEIINFMTKYGRGLVCLALSEESIDQFELPLMTHSNNTKFNTPFTVTVGAAEGITTGISAYDRAKTVQILMDANSTKKDIVTPGHIFPLRAHKYGLLGRQGHTEGGIDITRLAGFKPGAVICEVMNDDGSMARLPELKKFAEQHHLKIISTAQIINYRKKHELFVELAAEAPLPLTHYGDYTIKAFTSILDNQEHLALIKLPENSTIPPLVRIHSECFTGDILGSARCDCGWQLETALEKMSKEGGILIYLRQEGRGIGLINKLKAYQLQDEGLDTVEANIRLGFNPDQRDFTVAAHILRFLGIPSVRLLTNNPQKEKALNDLNIHVIERLSLEINANPYNYRYLRSKRDKLGHLLTHLDKEIK
ncbi:MAG: Riboflavin biosynthesis protein RibBA [Legionellaceae bacterium]